MSPVPHSGLSRRERQIMEVLYRRNGATVAEVLEEIPNPPSYSAVRTTVNILEKKGYLGHVRKGKKYFYRTLTPRKKAMQGAVRNLLSTYFDNSLQKAVTAMIALHGGDLSPADLARLEKMILRRRKKEVPG
jgi:BlaI family penicillinase repressor